MITALLAHIGLETAAVDDLAAAIGVLGAARAEKGRFALTLVDVHATPELGPRLADALTAAGPVAGPLVAVLPSGSPPSLARRVLGVDVAGVVVKPVTEHDLVAQLERLAAREPAAAEPATPVTGGARAPAPGAHTPSGVAASSSALRVLVVEDNPINQKLAARACSPSAATTWRSRRTAARHSRRSTTPASTSC
ncbi:MAG: hypothetical protein IPK07_04880 [Deltaproteobacteria bacterium]|nr:hypothetical protein [Deltaproteobacteria bacterium]